MFDRKDGEEMKDIAENEDGLEEGMFSRKKCHWKEGRIRS